MKNLFLTPNTKHQTPNTKHKQLVLIAILTLFSLFTSIGSFGQQLPEPECTDVFPWTNYFPNDPIPYTDWITLCPDFTRVNLGAGTGAKLTVGVGLLTGQQISDYSLEWTQNYRYFKSIQLENNTVLKWENPEPSGDNWCHGIVQDGDYGLLFLRSQNDDTYYDGYASFGIQNSGDVEVMGAHFMLGGDNATGHKRWSFQTQFWDPNSNDLFIHPETGVNSNSWDMSNFFVFGANGDFHVNGGDIHVTGGDIRVTGNIRSTANAYICGTVRATEIIVDNGLGWCDYVFEDDYQLMSLSNLRKYITTNKHLPNVPKAETVEAEGIKVGEMNQVMMEKIEEMYLYILQLEKRVIELEQ